MHGIIYGMDFFYHKIDRGKCLKISFFLLVHVSEYAEYIRGNDE